MRSHTNGFACSGCQCQPIEKKAKQSADIIRAECPIESIISGCPLKKIRFGQQIFCFVVSVGINGRNHPVMGYLKQLTNFSEEPPSHCSNEKKLASAFVT